MYIIPQFKNVSNKKMLMFLFCFLLALLHGMRDLTSLTRDQTLPLAVDTRSPNHWTAREFPKIVDVNNKNKIIEGKMYEDIYHSTVKAKAGNNQKSISRGLVNSKQIQWNSPFLCLL